MTHFFLYIEAGTQLDEDTRFYKVTIGESKKGIKQRAWLESYAIEHAHFFAIWSYDAADFLERCRNSIGPQANMLSLISGENLIKHLKTGTDDPESYLANVNRHHMMMQLDPHYFAYYQIGRK